MKPWLDLVRSRRAVVLFATLAGVALTARLGAWQLDRAAQKVALQTSLEQRRAMPELAASSLAAEPGEAAAQHHRRVRLQGQWMSGHTVFLDNRQMNGHPGFFVVTPLWLPDQHRAVLVQRGWAPRDFRDRGRLPSLPAAPGTVTVEGRVAPPPARLYQMPGEDRGPIRQNLELQAFEKEVGVRLAPVSVVQDGATVPDDGLSRHWPRPAVDVHKHYGYAFQWFALCALMAGLYVWFQVLRPRLQRGA
jgi:surfeit locus 1 family protein